MTPSITTFSITLNKTPHFTYCVYAECRPDECFYAECRGVILRASP